MKVNFFIPKCETIPTRLRVRVNDNFDVYYERLSDAFGYKFSFFKHQGVTLETATAITNEIVSKMISQSYDHGAQWRECGEREIVDNETTWELSITVFFRVRDAW